MKKPQKQDVMFIKKVKPLESVNLKLNFILR